jgi:hypothetical protein
MNLWDRIFGRKVFPDPGIHCPFCGGGKIDSAGGYVYLVGLAPVVLLEPGLTRGTWMKQGTNSWKCCTSTPESEPCIPTGHPDIRTRPFIAEIS